MSATFLLSDPHVAVVDLSSDAIPLVPASRRGRHEDPTLADRRRGEVEVDLSSYDLAAAEAPAADPLIGLVVADRYRIVEPIGRGGMGVVYKVEHVRIGKLLAMKVLTGELSRNPDAVRRFKREALTVSRLQSPSTVQVFDFGVADGLTYLVMELVGGESLGRVLHTRGPMPFARLGKILIQVCTALAEAHQKGIVHRDIKPENIMILPAEAGTDVAKVLDFGLAKLRETENLGEITGQGIVMGTPHYMAPEQIRGDEVDARSDVYGVGALMYRALTGLHPFTGTPMAVLTKHLHEAPVPPHVRAPDLDIPPGVSAIVMRALSKRPADRFPDIEAMRAALVEEVRAAGSTSVESLLDAGRLRRLARAAEAASSDHRRTVAIATRDEVDAYERKLRHKRYGAAISAALVLGAAAGAAGAFLRGGSSFAGVEIEPNDTAADATYLPLGRPVKAHLGKRLDETRGDRDFYAFDLPAAEGGTKAALRLRVGALPNLPMCTMLYKPGFPDALGQYCVGRAGRDLVIPALALDPGRYLIAVVQDMDPYGGAPPFVHENISDSYTVLAERADPEPGVEIEPNDRIASATRLGLSVPCAAAIGWNRDEDVFCIDAAVSAPIRWKLRTGLRDRGVLEATPIRGNDEAAPIRIHGEERAKPTDADAVSPWRSAPVPADGTSERCLRVRLTADPWSTDRAGSVVGGQEPYVVEVEAVP